MSQEIPSNEAASAPKLPRIQRADWVSTQGSSLVGCVKRIAKDGRWVDVDWGTHTKRMPTQVLRIRTTLPLGGGWEVTDLTRQKDLQQEEEQQT